MLWAIVVIVLLLWVLGFAFDVAGGFVHILLVIALIAFIFNMVTMRRG